MNVTTGPLGRLAVALTAVTLLAGACGGDGAKKGVANVGPSGDAPASQNAHLPKNQAEVRNAALAYAKCMREKGVTAFPDPDANGGLTVDGKAVHQDSPQFKAADQACKSLMPAVSSGQQGSAKDRADGVKYTQCMRTHGVPKFPDPNAEGGIDIDGDKLGVDPAGPVFKAADKECQKVMGGGKPVKSGPPQQSGG
ncbi:hypothetical protein [Actinomadura macrotermitis]|uniref:Lipoprotein n=1 Tax=Actinomadura macrotermitis TaxID=2585200 RepID=A0A7K0C7A0_9ACTN|nr:hypothetical protein [Actinomadura macrotermitis]MQY09349.1 hypothetical protein [Actinomadura macrotermitis]